MLQIHFQTRLVTLRVRENVSFDFRPAVIIIYRDTKKEKQKKSKKD